MCSAEYMERSVATALATTCTRNTDLTQATAERNARLRIRGQIGDNPHPLFIRHNRLGPFQKTVEFDDGLETGHLGILYANDLYVNSA
jgi:hypothetical protein